MRRDIGERYDEFLTRLAQALGISDWNGRTTHLYRTGGLRRTHLRGHANILKRLLVHIGGFNLGLFMRTVIGIGTTKPPGSASALLAILGALSTRWWSFGTAFRLLAAIHPSRLRNGRR